MKRKTIPKRIPRNINGPLGSMAMKIPTKVSSNKIRKKILTRRGIAGLSRIIINGRVMSMATMSDPRSVLDTTIGIDLINSPIIPVAISNGRKAKTVVSVVVKIGTRKSRQTRRPVSSGLNRPVRK